MQTIAPNLDAHHATLVHILVKTVLHQIRHAQSAVEGSMQHYQAQKHVLTVLQAAFAMKLDFLATKSALLEDTPTSNHN